MIFFKGCPLRCTWCQNPESWYAGPEVAFKSHLCIGCNLCMDNCPEQAIFRPGHRDPSRCTRCFSCVDHCPSRALEGFGKSYSIASIRDILRPEYPFYRDSGGGITFSGGEPSLYMNFIERLSGVLKEDGISITLETCGDFDPGIFYKRKKMPIGVIDDMPEPTNLCRPGFLKDVDLVLFDIKLVDDLRHRQFCGKGNTRIQTNLSNLATLAKIGGGPRVWPRMPVIPNITDTVDNLSGWADYLLKSGVFYLTLVPYHNLGSLKRIWLNITDGPVIPALKTEELEKTVQILTDYGISCFSPGEEDWQLSDR